MKAVRRRREAHRSDLLDDAMVNVGDFVHGLRGRVQIPAMHGRKTRRDKERGEGVALGQSAAEPGVLAHLVHGEALDGVDEDELADQVLQVVAQIARHHVLAGPSTAA